VIQPPGERGRRPRRGETRAAEDAELTGPDRLRTLVDARRPSPAQHDAVGGDPLDAALADDHQVERTTVGQSALTRRADEVGLQPAARQDPVGLVDVLDADQVRAETTRPLVRDVAAGQDDHR